VVQADAVRRAEELVGAVIEAVLDEVGVGDTRQMRGILELDDRGAIGQDIRDQERDDRSDDEREQVGELGADGQVRRGRRRRLDGLRVPILTLCVSASMASCWVGVAIGMGVGDGGRRDLDGDR
jgi:hypothetical protein